MTHYFLSVTRWVSKLQKGNFDFLFCLSIVEKSCWNCNITNAFFFTFKNTDPTPGRKLNWALKF